MIELEILQYLAEKGVGVMGTNMAVEMTDPPPHDLLTVRSYPGGRPVRAKAPAGVLLLRSRFQVACRSPDASAALRRAWLAFGHLDSFDGGELSGRYYATIRPLQEPTLLGRDENGMEQAICNYEVLRNPSKN